MLQICHCIIQVDRGIIMKYLPTDEEVEEWAQTLYGMSFEELSEDKQEEIRKLVIESKEEAQNDSNDESLDDEPNWNKKPAKDEYNQKATRAQLIEEAMTHQKHLKIQTLSSEQLSRMNIASLENHVKELRQYNARKAQKARINDSIQGFDEALINIKSAKEWASKGFTPTEAAIWYREGFTAQQASLWKELSPIEAKQWMQAGITNALHAKEYALKGRFPKEVAQIFSTRLYQDMQEIKDIINNMINFKDASDEEIISAIMEKYPTVDKKSIKPIIDKLRQVSPFESSRQNAAMTQEQEDTIIEIIRKMITYNNALNREIVEEVRLMYPMIGEDDIKEIIKDVRVSLNASKQIGAYIDDRITNTQLIEKTFRGNQIELTIGIMVKKNDGNIEEKRIKAYYDIKDGELKNVYGNEDYFSKEKLESIAKDLLKDVYPANREIAGYTQFDKDIDEHEDYMEEIWNDVANIVKEKNWTVDDLIDFSKVNAVYKELQGSTSMSNDKLYKSIELILDAFATEGRIIYRASKQKAERLATELTPDEKSEIIEYIQDNSNSSDDDIISDIMDFWDLDEDAARGVVLSVRGD